MDLFSNTFPEEINLLPYDGEVFYYGKILSENYAYKFRDELKQDIDWQHDEALIFGKRILTKRKVAWYGDQPFSYSYSNHTKIALPWTPTLIKIKNIVEKVSKEKFNSCLLNLYHDGSEGMAWHSDAEKDLKENGAIASLTLGAERKFSFKHKVKGIKVDINLAHGSLLIMTGDTQKNWLHRLPPTSKQCAFRINLTFRTIVQK